MTQNVAQWLAEIKSLKQQLAEAHRERDEAYASAANWQRLYETEAHQRRVEANLARQTIAGLEQEVQQLQQRPAYRASDSTKAHWSPAEADLPETVTELKARLMTTLAECERLAQSLKAEQDNHAHTRKSLTTALGDAVEMLSRYQHQATDEPSA